MRIILSIVLLLVSTVSFAANEASGREKIIRLLSFSEFGGGDVQIVLETNGSICADGYWLRATDPGFNANVSMLLSAYHSKEEVTIVAHSDLQDKWPGSSGYFCRVNYVKLGN